MTAPAAAILIRANTVSRTYPHAAIAAQVANSPPAPSLDSFTSLEISLAIRIVSDARWQSVRTMMMPPVTDSLLGGAYAIDHGLSIACFSLCMLVPQVDLCSRLDPLVDTASAVCRQLAI